MKRLKTREFLSLLRVITTGLGPALGQVRLDFNNQEAIARDLAALMVLAVPNAMEEFSVFLATIVEPVDGGHAGEVARYLHDNPDLDEMLEIFTIVAEQEREDLSSLAGKAQAMWSRIGPLYGAKTTTTS